jgi:hypothetical protein
MPVDATLEPVTLELVETESIADAVAEHDYDLSVCAFCACAD